MVKKKRSLFFDKKSQNRLFYGLIMGIVLIGILSLYFVSAPSFNPQDNRTIGYEFLNLSGNIVNSSLGEVVHIWNTQDDYYFNKSSGIQFTNHFEDYWTKNVFCIGYYSGEEWIKIKCADELSDFNKNIQTDNLTYVNATLWKDITYSGYDMRLGINYYLGLNDQNLSITIYGKNIGVDIPFDLGFAWKVADWNIPPNITNDNILINNTSYLLNGTYNILFKNMNESYFKGYDNDFWGEKFLRINWNKSLNYTVKMYGDGNQSNFSIALLINAGHFNPNQDKSTTFYWIDAITLGNNSGFVTTAPTADPGGTAELADTRASAIKDTSPTTAVKVTEIGWWADTATEESNYEVGIYDDNAAEEPNLLLSGADQTNAKGTGAGWKRVTGLNITISPSTIYWIAFQLDNTATATNTDFTASGGPGIAFDTKTTLSSDWGVSDLKDTNAKFAIYAVWEAADTIYPNFSSFWDDNATLVGSGTGKFNVTVENTNGTVLLEINNTNITATNLTSNVYNVSYNFTGSGAYTYRWHSWGNGTSKNYNKSADRSYTVNYSDTIFPQINFTSPTPSNGSTQSATSIYVNVTANDSASNVSTFIDFDNSLVSWWRMDDVNATTGVIDYMGRNNGTKVGDATQTDAGKMGKGFEFDGDGDYVSVSAQVYSLSGGTVSLWFMRKGNGTGDNVIIGSYGGTGNQRAPTFYGTGTSLGWEFGSDYTNIVAGVTVNANQWYHIAMTYNSSYNVKVYFDGAQVDSSTSSDPGDFFDQVHIGHYANYGIHFFQGTIDDVMLFNRSLSAEEIRGLYANTSIKYVSNNFTGLGLGAHTFKAYAQDTGGNVNATEQRTVTISVTDTEYPQFSNYWDDNATLVDSGTGKFNVTVTSTNGTVILHINGTNITATNLSANVYNASHTFGSSGTYLYNWTAYGNGTSKNLNTSINRDYTVNVTSQNNYSRNVSQSLISSALINRFGNLKKNIIGTFSMGNLINRISKPLRELTQTLQVSNIVNRIYISLRTTIQNLNINTLTTRLTLSFKSIAQTLNLDTLTSKIYSTITSLTQSLNIDTFVNRLLTSLRTPLQSLKIDIIINRLTLSFKNIFQQINLDILASKVYSTITSLTQSININTFVNRLFITLKTTIQSININTSINRLTLSLKSITQSLNINLIIGTLRDTFGTIIQIVNVDDFISRLTLSLKSIIQSLNLNTLTSRIYSTITSLTQNLQIGNIINRIFTALRTPFQSFNIDTMLSRLTLSLKSITQSINIDTFISRAYSTITSLTQSLNLDTFTSRLFTALRTPLQSLNIDTFISRLTLSLKSITQPFNINIFISKSYSTITSLIQSLNLDTFTSRLLTSLRSPIQSLNIDSIISRLTLSLKSITQSFNIDTFISKSYSTITSLIQSINLDTFTSRLLTSLRSPIQSLNIDSIISRLTLSLKSIIQSLNLNLITGTLRDTFGTIIQVINVNDFISRLTLSLKSIVQSLNINTLTSRVYATITSLTQTLQVNDFVNRVFISLRTTIQTLKIDIFINRISLIFKDTLQTLNINLITGTLRDTFGTIIQVINVNDFTSRISLIFKNTLQSLNINTLTSRIYSTITSLTQTLQVNDFINRISLSLKTAYQTINIGAITNRIFLPIRDLFQNLNIDITINRFILGFRNIFQFLNTSIFIDKLREVPTTIYQGIDLSSITERIGNLFKNIPQSLNINALTSRLSNFFTNLFQTINIEAITNRIFLPIRDLFQNLNIDITISKIYAAITSVSQNLNFSDIVNRIYSQIKTITQNINISSIVSRLANIIRNIFQNILITIIKVRDVITGVTPPTGGGGGFLIPTNETRICIDVYYFIIENMDNKGELVYTKDDLNNLTAKISEVKIVNTAQAINYIENYNELCENLTGLKIPKKKLPLPTIWANFTIFKGERLTCSPIINQTFLLINFDKAISCWWSDCGVNVGSIECNTLDFYRWLAKFEKQGDNYTLTGIKLYLIIIIFLVGSIMSTLLIKSKLKRLEKGKKVHSNFLMIGILLLLIFMGIFIFLNVLSFVQNERPKCSTLINQDFLGFIDLDSSLNCWWNEGNCGVNVNDLECNSLDFWRFIFHYKQLGDNYLLNGVKIWWVISLFIIGGIVSGLLIRKRVKNLEKNR